ncbi:MAG: prenyltransferase/squalene oxidase repeat-containing protein [Chloroflexota bacterium]
MIKLRYDAVKYVRDNGNSYEKLYLAVGLSQRVDRGLIEELLALQNPDGGWPRELEKQMPSGVTRTSRVLELLLKVWLDKNSPIATNAIHFLLASQRADGGWSENPELSKFVPKDEAWVSTTYSMTYATADVVNALGKAGYSGHPSVQKAIAFLHKTQNEEGGWNSHIGPDYPYGTDIAGMDVIVKALLLSGEDKESVIFKRAIEAILKNHADWKYPVCASSVLNVFLRLGYNPGHPHVQELVNILVETQKPDGGWNELGEGSTDPGQTVYCIKQLKKCGVGIFPVSPTDELACQ